MGEGKSEIYLEIVSKKEYLGGGKRKMTRSRFIKVSNGRQNQLISLSLLSIMKSSEGVNFRRQNPVNPQTRFGKVASEQQP